MNTHIFPIIFYLGAFITFTVVLVLIFPEFGLLAFIPGMLIVDFIFGSRLKYSGRKRLMHYSQVKILSTIIFFLLITWLISVAGREIFNSDKEKLDNLIFFIKISLFFIPITWLMGLPFFVLGSIINN